LTGSSFLLLLLFLLASCGGGGGGGYSAPAPPPGTPPLVTPAVEVVACTGTISATVDALGTTNFSPAGVTITVNQVVQWNNNSGVAHTVTSATVPANGNFDAALNNGTSVCLRFTIAGAFNYFCRIHPNMTGLVTVN